MSERRSQILRKLFEKENKELIDRLIKKMIDYRQDSEYKFLWHKFKKIYTNHLVSYC